MIQNPLARPFTTNWSPDNRSVNLQEQNGLVLRAMAQPEEGSVRHVLGAGHSAALLSSIDALGAGRVRIQGNETVRAQPGGGQVDVEPTGEVAGNVRVGLEVVRQHGQRRLGVGGAAASASLKMGGHDEPETARIGVWGCGGDLNSVQNGDILLRKLSSTRLLS